MSLLHNNKFLITYHQRKKEVLAQAIILDRAKSIIG
jgi:hypothetical protein